MKPAITEIPGITLTEVQTLLNSHGVPVTGALRVAALTGGKSNLTYRVSDDECSWVVRRPPLGELLPTAHDISREFEFISALRDSAVPVPETVALSRGRGPSGVPFSVVQYVRGATVRSQADLDLLSDGQTDRFCEDLMRVLTCIHQVDYRKLGLGRFGHPNGFLGRQIERWQKQWISSRTRSLPDVTSLYLLLKEQLPTVSASTSLAHGDFREDNTIIDFHSSTVIQAVVDWEMATIGDPLFDLALFCVYRDPLFDLVLGMPAASTSPRLPTVHDFVESYAKLSDHDINNWEFYYALAYFKLAVISEGIYVRGMHAASPRDESNKLVGEAVPGLIANGIRLLTKKEPWQ